MHIGKNVRATEQTRDFFKSEHADICHCLREKDKIARQQQLHHIKRSLHRQQHTLKESLLGGCIRRKHFFGERVHVFPDDIRHHDLNGIKNGIQFFKKVIDRKRISLCGIHNGRNENIPDRDSHADGQHRRGLRAFFADGNGKRKRTQSQNGAEQRNDEGFPAREKQYDHERRRIQEKYGLITGHGNDSQHTQSNHQQKISADTGQISDICRRQNGKHGKQSRQNNGTNFYKIGIRGTIHRL